MEVEKRIRAEGSHGPNGGGKNILRERGGGECPGFRTASNVRNSQLQKISVQIANIELSGSSTMNRTQICAHADESKNRM